MGEIGSPGHVQAVVSGDGAQGSVPCELRNSTFLSLPVNEIVDLSFKSGGIKHRFLLDCGHAGVRAREDADDKREKKKQDCKRPKSLVQSVHASHYTRLRTMDSRMMTSIRELKEGVLFIGQIRVMSHGIM